MSADTTAPVDAVTYERLALAHPEGNLELHQSHLRRKPPMTMEHNDIATWLGHLLMSQLDRDEYRVRVNMGRAQLDSSSYYIPHVMVIPAELARRHAGRPNALEAYAEALPFVAELWSQSTGDDDAQEKVHQYQRRGDLEIWLIHPYDQTVKVWRKLPGDTGYDELDYHAADLVNILTLPSVEIDLHELFETTPRH